MGSTQEVDKVALLPLANINQPNLVSYLNLKILLQVFHQGISFNWINYQQLGVVCHTCKASIWEAEAGK